MFSCSLVRWLVVRLSMPSSPCNHPLEQSGRRIALEDAYGQEQRTDVHGVGLDPATSAAIAALHEIDIRWASEMERNVELDDAQRHRGHVNALRAQHPAVKVTCVNNVLGVKLVVQMVVKPGDGANKGDMSARKRASCRFGAGGAPRRGTPRQRGS